MAADASLARYLASEASDVSYSNLPDEKEFIRHRARFTKNWLTIGGWQLVGTWISGYMKMLASIAAKNGGNILEIGFGMGLSSKFIQENPKVKSHTIIEAHPDVCAHARKMFRKEIAEGKIILIEGFWEDAVRKLPKGSFDGILFDSYTLGGGRLCNKAKTQFCIEEGASGKKVLKIVFDECGIFFKEAYSLLRRGGVLTYHSPQRRGFSEMHLDALRRVGFSKIDSKVCRVNPPKSCLYWKHKTILAPIITK